MRRLGLLIAPFVLAVGCASVPPLDAPRCVVVLDVEAASLVFFPQKPLVLQRDHNGRVNITNGLRGEQEPWARPSAITPRVP